MILKEGDKIEVGGMAAFWVFAPYSMTLDILTVGMTVTIMFTDIVESDCAHGSSGRFSGPFSVANP